MHKPSLLFLSLLCLPAASHASAPGNRLAYLDEFLDPYYVNRTTSRLTTPQWTGAEGAEAVIVLAVDDMADTARYEAFLRPIIDRLKKIDGRAGISIMTTRIDSKAPQIQKWLVEGLHVEAHTATHPCPCLQKDDLRAAKATFDQCVDQLNTIPGNRPVAFRMPCCDSMNSVSPRFFAEIFNKTTPGGHFLTMDTSVFLLFTPDDPTLTREMVFDKDGNQRFRKYIPRDRMMVNYVEDYPYPYVVGRLCWEFPALMPSDWDAQHLNGKCSPTTLRDLKVAVDATVAKQGVFSLCFHPHGWIRNDQVVELIDYAVQRYGTRVRFIKLQEVEQQLTENLLGGQPLRNRNGQDNGVRVCDVNHDGYLDAIVANDEVRQTRIWSPNQQQWHECEFPFALVCSGDKGQSLNAGAQFGVLQSDGQASVLIANNITRGLWHFAQDRWVAAKSGFDGLESDAAWFTSESGCDRGIRLHDLDLDGICELIVSNPNQQAVFQYQSGSWHRQPFALPDGMTIVDKQGRDAGLRFVDFDEDGHDDVVFSNASRCATYLFHSMSSGWSRKIFDRSRQSTTKASRQELPMIVRADGTNNGAWFKYQHMWVQNEQTGGTMEHHVDHRKYADAFAE